MPNRPTGTALTLGQANAVPLGLTVAQVVRRLGTPVIGLRQRGHYRCLFYDVAGQPPSDRLQFCFSAGKLVVIASSIT